MTRNKDELVEVLLRAGARTTRHIETAIRPHGLASISQFRFLRAIVEAPGGYLHVGDLDEAALTDASDNTRILDNLTRCKYVKRIHDECDRRRVRIVATALGARVLADAEPDYCCAVNEALSALTDKDCAEASHFIQGISETIEELYV